MNIQIEISTNTLERLQKHAVPLIDTYDSTINKLMDEVKETTTDYNFYDDKKTKSPTPSVRLWLAQVPELRNINGLYVWKDICLHLGLDSTGDSARRVLKRWAKKNRPDWPPIPEP